MSEVERLHKVIARSGYASRRAAEDLISAGRVKVDGRPALIGQKVDAELAEVVIDGIPLPVRCGLVYYLANKPPGVVSTAHDPQGRPTVLSLVPEHPRVFPVGRLDLESEGLIILTNDGELANLVTHPRYQVPKTYSVLVDGKPQRSVLSSFEKGIELEDGIATARSVRAVGSSDQGTLLEFVMTEGKKREIRRMVEAAGYQVLRLFRNSIGPITDPSLKSGRWRELTSKEVRNLYRAAHRE